MRPIPETVEVVTEIGRYDDDFDLMAHLQGIADEVQVVVPDCVGLSIAWTDRDVVFTLVSSDEEIAVLDALQYLGGGPCVEAVERGEGVHWSGADPLNEDVWREFTQATAAHGVKSTLTLPLTTSGQIVGTANLYAASDNAFEGHAQVLADILGGSAADIVRNADLSFTTLAAAEAAPEALRSADVFDQAVGLLIGGLGVDPDAAKQRLVNAAAKTRLSPLHLAQALVAIFGGASK